MSSKTLGLYALFFALVMYGIFKIGTPVPPPLESQDSKFKDPEALSSAHADSESLNLKGIKPQPQFKTSQPSDSKQVQTPPLKSEGLEPSATKSAETSASASQKVRFEVYGKYAMAGEDIILGELTSEDQKRWEGQKDTGATTYGSLTWSKGIELWHRGVVPYAISADLPRSQAQEIEAAIEEFHQHTSLRFVPYSGEVDALYFVPDPERCASYVGKAGGHQPILLAPDCGYKEILHEVMHALGFIHEHQRDNRDAYVEVHWSQVQEDKLINFDILPQDHQEIYRRLSVPFDSKSLMLYPPNAFAKDKEQGVTLTSRDPQKPLQPSSTLSVGDILKIQEVYERGL